LRHCRTVEQGLKEELTAATQATQVAINREREGVKALSNQTALMQTQMAEITDQIQEEKSKHRISVKELEGEPTRHSES